ncbi:IPT/TIG domain-containing protein [Nitrobacter sp. TKz-YC01]|uniref:IPT/TIG domain-containing protein n=1 Tax=Nitrobacter sp. TKz-YC01 TaxID=3398703 RepID=UPI003A0FC7AB
MIGDRFQHLRSSRTARDSVAYALALAALFLMGLFWSNPASAQQCPAFNITVAHGGSVTESHCIGGFIGFNPIGSIPPGELPQHGTLTIDTVADTFTYTHNGDAATTDFFRIRDSDNVPIDVNVTITPPTSPITITPGTLSLQAGTPFSQQLTASGGTGSYTFALDAGSPPPGLSLSAGGLISGTPTQRGNYSFTVRATDSTSASGLQSYSGSTANPSLTVTPTTSSAPLGSLFSVTYTPGGGVGPYTASLAFGATLPPGLHLSGFTLSGTPTTLGNYSFQIVVQDSSTGPGNWFQFLSVTVNVVPALPTITSVTPNTGPTTGGTSVTITGTNFTGATSVTFGGAPATGVTVVNDTAITATTPAHAAGAVAVAVTTPGGTVNSGSFTYAAPAPTVTSVAPNTGPPAGGTPVTITGTNFTGATAVTFGGTPATGVTVVNDTTITATTPAHAAGAVAVAVTTSGGTNSLPNGFTYSALAPSIISVTPNTGPATGGTPVTITGTNFTGATAVTFGGAPATGVTVVNDTTITATTPAHAAGAVAVAVTTPGGTNSLPNGFTYSALAPSIISVTPNTGPATGGTPVTITGTNFTGATAVTFGGTAATSITVINDSTITATTPAHAAGSVAVAVTTPGGNASLPGGFTYSAPVPTVTSHTLQLTAGASGTVSLTQGATGGPFTAATIVTSPPASDGTTSIVQNGTQWQLVYASAAGAASTVIVRYTLSNASGTSAPGTVTFTVVARPDPSRDREVIGLLNAQAQSAQRFARSQITNFRDRLEQLHDDSNREATSMNVRLAGPQDPTDPNALGYARETRASDPTRNAFAYAPNDAGPSRPPTKAPPPKRGSLTDLAVWAGGFVNFGTANRYNVGLGHTLIGVSGGVDYRFSPGFTAGVGVGYGRDTVDVGNSVTQSRGQALSTAIYGSYHPRNNTFIDALLGYSALDFDSRRFVTPTSGMATGGRSGNQVFGSIIGGYEYKSSRALVSPYGRIESAWTQLNAFTESGAAAYDLAFGKQTLSMLAGVLGMRAEYVFLRDWGVVKARGRLEYTHDFTGSSLASMGYADLRNGLPYTLGVNVFTRDYIAVGLGFDTPVGNGATLGFDYTTALGLDGRTEVHNFALRLGAKF